jgi:hypothetical protein
MVCQTLEALLGADGVEDDAKASLARDMEERGVDVGDVEDDMAAIG